ncbi:MAG: hypothetical protein ABIH21_03740 [Patescibacteria group bacterium]
MKKYIAIAIAFFLLGFFVGGNLFNPQNLVRVLSGDAGTTKISPNLPCQTDFSEQIEVYADIKDPESCILSGGLIFKGSKDGFHSCMTPSKVSAQIAICELRKYQFGN